MSYGTSLGITLPTVGVTAGPEYATSVNSALSTLITTLEAKVTPAGMDISSDLDFKSASVYSAALNLERATFENKDAALSAATFPTALYLVAGELYFNDNAGNQVQITSGGAVNIATTGGITGSGYGSGDVEVNWDSGSTKYRLRSGSGADDFASVELNDVLMNDGSGNTLTVAAPALGANYTWTFPSAVPGSTSLLQMSSAGAVSTTLTPTVTTLTSTGLITGGAGLTASANQHVTVSGTGAFKHGNFTLVQSAVAGVASYDAVANEPGMVPQGGPVGTMIKNAAAATASHALEISFPLKVGDRPQSASVYVNRGSSAGVVTATLYINGTLIDTETSPSGTGAATLSLTDPSPAALVAGDDVVIHVDFGSSGTGAYCLSADLVHDRP